jgi:hypothetical protein
MGAVLSMWGIAPVDEWNEQQTGSAVNGRKMAASLGVGVSSAGPDGTVQADLGMGRAVHPVDRLSVIGRVIMNITCTFHRMLLIGTLLAASIIMPLQAEDSDAIAAFTQASAGSDAAAKRAALTAISAMGRDADDTVYPLLVQAVGDPQIHDVAVLALRTRTQQSPYPYDRPPSFPGYLALDTPPDWDRWLALRSQYKEKERALADEARRLAALSKPSSSAAGGASGSAAPTAGAERRPASAAPALASDLGQLSRIIFADGATVVGYVITRHRDADGTVLSVEFIHQNAGGREVIPIDRIARIEEAP